MSGEPRPVSESEFDELGVACFGPIANGSEESRSERPSMSADEASWVVLDSAFSGYDPSALAEAQRVLASLPSDLTPAPTRGAAALEKSDHPPPNDLLAKVLASESTCPLGFSEDQNRRLSTAFRDLEGLAESRLGMPHEHALNHARIAFLEMQHTSSTLNETGESFVRRVEQRTAGYQAMQRLVSQTYSGGRS